MRRLYYSSGSMVLDDQVCKAVLRYARALAIAEKSDIVSVPMVGEDGEEGLGHLLIGPASELFSTPARGVLPKPAPEAVAEMERMTAELDAYRPAWESEMPEVPDLDL